MPHNRFYINSPFNTGDEILLKDSEFHHLMVSKVRLGQSVQLINGKGQLAQAKITSLDKRQATLQIDIVTDEQEKRASIILAQGLPRMNHLEWIVEKGTELGVTAFWLFPGILSEKCTLSENQTKRLEHLILAATKQCGRLDLPTIELKTPLEKWTPLQGTLLYGDPSPEAPFLWKLPISPSSPIILFIGPESGFDPRELSYLKNTMHAQSVRLHPNTLRTETASLAALSLLQTFLYS